jgi:hypothetical protein
LIDARTRVTYYWDACRATKTLGIRQSWHFPAS